MKSLRKLGLGVFTGLMLTIGAVHNVSAQSLKQQISGAWTLSSGLEELPGGKKSEPWAAGSLILDPSGHLSLILVGKDRPTGSDDIRMPTGPFVAWYGTYAVNEANKTVAYKIERNSSPKRENVTGAWKVSVTGAGFTTTTQVQTPKGAFATENDWTRAK